MTDDLEKVENQETQIGVDSEEDELGPVPADIERKVQEDIRREFGGSAKNTEDEAPPSGTKEESETSVNTFKPANDIERGLADFAKENDVNIDENVSKLLRKLSSSVGTQSKEREESMDASLSNINLGGASEEDLNAVISPLRGHDLYKGIGLTEKQEKMLAVAMYSSQKHKPADRVAPVVSPAKKRVDSEDLLIKALRTGDQSLFRREFRKITKESNS